MIKTMYGSLEVEDLMASSDEDFEIQINQIKEIPSKSSLKSTATYISSYGKILISTVSVMSIVLILYISLSTGRNSMLSLYLSSNQLLTKSSLLSFTLNRQNYPVLSTFTENRKEFLTYNILRDFTAVIEPHVPMQLYMMTNDGDNSNGDISKYNYHFEACLTSSDSESTLSSSSSSSSSSSKCYSSVAKASEESGTITIPCKPHSIYNIKVTEYSTETNHPTGRTSQGNAMCMYVRREISALTPDDLSATMDALHKLWEFNEEEGREKFGDDFHSATFFSEAHHFNSAWIESDHIHEGLGFIPQHIKLTNRVEKAMQATNPSVTMPYWEFTKEVAEGKSIYDSYMFTEKTFGSLYRPKDTRFGFSLANERIDDGAIPDGRWAYLQADNLRFDKLKNAFGLLKAPWSLNPSKYITRYAAETPSLPSCTQYYKAASYKDGTFIEFLDIMQKDPHASVHQVIGNTYGCDALSPLMEKNLIIPEETAQIGLCKAWSYYMKDLYRNAFITPQISKNVKGYSVNGDDGDGGSTCDGTTANPCRYVCDTSRREEMTTFISQLVNKRFIPNDMTSENWESFVDFICGGDASKMFIGTHMESSSSADPSFWPVHPTQERVMHAKMMANLVTSWTWPTSTSEGYVCDTSNCYSDETKTKANHAICCKGHYEYDTLLDFATGDREGSYGETNHDILVASNPVLGSYTMPYIYDEFDWSHCGKEDIMTSLEEQYTAAISRDSSITDPNLEVYTKNVIGQAGGGKVLPTVKSS